MVWRALALSIGALTFNGAATVNTFSNSTSAPIATTALATNAAGNVTINASSTGWTDNAIHELISYGGGSVGGAGSTQFVLGTVSGLSARQVALPLGDTGTAITLTITGDTPYWTGDGDGKWNTGSINNWKLVSDNSSALFLTNDNALFNDSATGAGPISVDIDAADVAPNSTVFNNGTKDYVLGSTGGFGISSGSLVKNGGGKLTINNANTYPGGTTVNAGTLALGNANAIGTGLLTLNGGNLDSSVTNLVNSGNNAQLWNSDFTFIGTESLNLGTGAVTLSGNRSVTVAANNLTVGGSIGGGAVDLIKLGTGTLTLAGGTSFSGILGGQRRESRAYAGLCGFIHDEQCPCWFRNTQRESFRCEQLQPDLGRRLERFHRHGQCRHERRIRFETGHHGNLILVRCGYGRQCRERRHLV